MKRLSVALFWGGNLILAIAYTVYWLAGYEIQLYPAMLNALVVGFLFEFVFPSRKGGE